MEAVAFMQHRGTEMGWQRDIQPDEAQFDSEPDVDQVVLSCLHDNGHPQERREEFK